MSDRDKMIEVITQWQANGDILPGKLADRLIEAGFGSVKKPETLVGLMTRNFDEENRE